MYLDKYIKAANGGEIPSPQSENTDSSPGFITTAGMNLLSGLANAVGGLGGYIGANLQGNAAQENDSENQVYQQMGLPQVSLGDNPSIGSGVGDWLTNNSQYLQDKANEVNRPYASNDSRGMERFLDLNYYTNPRGAMADVANGIGSSIPTIAASMVMPEIAVPAVAGSKLISGAGTILSKLGSTKVGPYLIDAVKRDGLQKFLQGAGQFGTIGGVGEAIEDAGGIVDDLKKQGYSATEIQDAVNKLAIDEAPMLMASDAITGGLLGGGVGAMLKGSGVLGNVLGHAGAIAADAAGEGVTEMRQQQLQKGYTGEPHGNWFNNVQPDEAAAGAAGVAGGLGMGLGGAAVGKVYGKTLGRKSDETGNSDSQDLPPTDTPPAEIAAGDTVNQDDIPNDAGSSVLPKEIQDIIDGNKGNNAGADQDVLPADIQAIIDQKTPVAQTDTGSLNFTFSDGDNPDWQDVTPVTKTAANSFAGELQKDYGISPQLTSGYRDAERNAAVNGAENSNHTKGKAVDLYLGDVDDDTADAILEKAESEGWGEVLYHDAGSGKHLHLGDFQGDTGSTGDSVMGTVDISGRNGGNIANMIASKTGLPADWVWAQMFHETGDFNSDLAREDHNYGGIKNEDGSYRHFDSDEEYADYAAKNLEAYREDGLFDAKNIDEFAAALKHGGYFEDSLENYTNGLKNALKGTGSVVTGTNAAGSKQGDHPIDFGKDTKDALSKDQGSFFDNGTGSQSYLGQAMKDENAGMQSTPANTKKSTAPTLATMEKFLKDTQYTYDVHTNNAIDTALSNGNAGQITAIYSKLAGIPQQKKTAAPAAPAVTPAPKTGTQLAALAAKNNVPMNRKLQEDLQADKPAAIKAITNKLQQKGIDTHEISSQTEDNQNQNNNANQEAIHVTGQENSTQHAVDQSTDTVSAQSNRSTEAPQVTTPGPAGVLAGSITTEKGTETNYPAAVLTNDNSQESVSAASVQPKNSLDAPVKSFSETDTSSGSVIEIKFSQAPSRKIKGLMKAANYKWNANKRCWWAPKSNEAAMDFAKKTGYVAKNTVESNQESDRTNQEAAQHSVDATEIADSTKDGNAKESTALHATAVKNFPELAKEEKTNGRVKNAIRSTVEAGNSQGTILQRATHGKPKSGRGNSEGNSQGQERKGNRLRDNSRIGTQTGLGITRKLVTDGAVSLVGKTITGTQDLAEIAQVLRHPGYEKFHRVYANKSGEIVYHETVSCMLPAESQILAPEDNGSFEKMIVRMDADIRRSGAEKMYLIHNHPSTDPTPSGVDIAITKQIANVTYTDGRPGVPNKAFAGHIVLDTDKYCVIDRDGTVSNGNIDPNYQIRMTDAEVPHVALGGKINDSDSFANFAKKLTDTSKTTAFFITRKNEIRGVMQLPEALTGLTPDKIIRYLRLAARSNFSDKCMIVTENKKDYDTLLPLVEKGHILDMMLTKENKFAQEEVDFHPDSTWFGQKLGQPAERLLEEGESYDSGNKNSVDEQAKGLSKEGTALYSKIKNILSQVNPAVAKTSSEAAYLYAKHADVMAQYMRQSGAENYTAADYAKTHSVQLDGALQDNTRAQANEDVNPDKQVPVVDITHALPKSVVTNKDLKQFVYRLIADNTKLTTADEKAIVEILPKDIKHIVYSSMPITYLNVSLRKASILSIKDLVEHATLIESIPNKKTDKKPNVETYHRFYVPVLFNGKLQTIRLVAETKKGDTSFNPLTVNLYDIILEKKSRPAKGFTLESGLPWIAANGSSYTISIRDMLRGVKDSNFKNYYQNSNDMMTEKKSRPAKGVSHKSGLPWVAANGSSSKSNISNGSTGVNSSGRGESQTYEQAAYHGSPYAFDKFSIDHIGDGEGNQAFGWGLYFAGNKSIAKWYKEHVGQYDGVVAFEKDGKTISYEDALSRYYTPNNIVKAYAGLDRIISYDPVGRIVTAQAVYLKNGEYVIDPDYPNPRRYWASVKPKELEKYMGTLGYILKNGRLYEVNISAEEKEMLDWYKPFSEQFEYVQNKLKLLAKEYEEQAGSAGLRYAISDDDNGAELYDRIKMSTGSPYSASEALNEVGIKAIKYLDSASRKAGKGNYNYVVFDDAAVDIIKTYEQNKGGVRGALTAFKNGEQILQLFKTADYSTFIHEAGHMFLEDLRSLATIETAPQEIKTAWETARDWAGYKDGADNTTAHEKWAKGFEAYLREGKAPSEDLKGVFQKFKNWLREIYQSVKELGGAPSKEIQRIMGTMLDAGDTIKDGKVTNNTPENGAQRNGNPPSNMASVAKAAEGAKNIRGKQSITSEELLQKAKESVPNGKDFVVDGNRVSCTLPNGSTLTFDVVDNIIATPEQLEKASQEHRVPVTDSSQIQGSMTQVGADGFIQLASDAEPGTIDHEVMEFALKTALIAKEKAVLEKAIPGKENQCDAYREWQKAHRNGSGTRFGKLWNKVQALADQVKAFFGNVPAQKRNAERVFEKVSRGDVWSRELGTPTISSDIEFSIKTAMDNLVNNFSKKKDDRIETRYKDGKNNFGSMAYGLRSPSWNAEKHPKFRGFFKLASTAMQEQEGLRSKFGRDLKRINRLITKTDDHQTWQSLLWQGDTQGQEFTKEELKQAGYGDNVIKAYMQTRIAIKKAYTLLNDTRKQVRTYQQNMSASKLEALRKNIFAEIIKVENVGDDTFLVAYRQPKTWEKEYRVASETLKDVLSGNSKWIGTPDTQSQVLSVTKNTDGTYTIKCREAMPDIVNRGGYVPHFFHEIFVMKKSTMTNEKGESIPVETMIGSARNYKEASKIAEEHLKTHPTDNLIIQPKGFSFDAGESFRAATVGDMDYRQVVDRLAKKMEMTPVEAKEALSGLIKTKARHRFFGNFMKRKGAKGFEQDMDWALHHYFNSTARYIALEKFKPASIGLFERYWGRFDNDHSSNAEATFAKQYINDVNGNPSVLENMVNNAFNSSRWWRNHVSARWGDRATLQATNNVTGKMSILKLGWMNISSAMLNLTQLMNTVGLLGDFSYVGKAMKQAISAGGTRANRVYKLTGISNDIRLDSASGYTKFRPGKLAENSLYLFNKMDMYARKVTVLAAYNKGIREGMTDKEAINYAIDINRKANFSYGVEDAPNLFRRTSGTIIGELALQFKKYSIKELELMYELTAHGSSAQKAKFWGTYLLLCGLMQFPAADLFDDLLSSPSLLGYSPKSKTKKMIMEAAGDSPIGREIAKIAIYGIFSASPVNADLSRRAGTADVIPTLDNGVIGLLGGPTASTINQLAQAIGPLMQADPIPALKALSPALGNYAQAALGYNEGRRGRKMTEFNGIYDSILKASGFRGMDESISSDVQSILSNERGQRTTERKKAVDDALATQAAGKQLSSEEVRNLQRLGVTGKMLNEERQNKNSTSKERLKHGMSRQELQNNQGLLQFLK